jgi:hypothetical protein
MLSTIQKLLLAFVTLIVGLVLVAQVATVGYAITSYTATTQTSSMASARLADGSINESVYFYPTHFIEAASGWRADTAGCSSTDISTSVRITNSSGSAFVDGVDTIINTAGSYTLVNTAKVNGTSNNVTLVSLNYCPDGYISGWGGTVLNLVPGFFALALLVFSVGMFYSLARDAGIL